MDQRWLQVFEPKKKLDKIVPFTKLGKLEREFFWEKGVSVVYDHVVFMWEEDIWLYIKRNWKQRD